MDHRTLARRCRHAWQARLGLPTFGMVKFELNNARCKQDALGGLLIFGDNNQLTNRGRDVKNKKTICLDKALDLSSTKDMKHLMNQWHLPEMSSLECT
jgi:hypothetical protein